MAGEPLTQNSKGDEPIPRPIDFRMASHYLNRAQAAREAGNNDMFIAARAMVLIALGLDLQ